MRWFYLLVSLFLLANLYYTYKGEVILNAIPVGLLLMYTAFYHFDKLFLFVVLFTPLSVNIEEFVSANVGLFLPTEPLLFGMLLLILFNQFRKNQFDKAFLRHPITIIFILQLVWILLTTITSTHPVVSAKFLLTKLWFIVPIYFYGVIFFKKEKNIYSFVWLYIGALGAVVLYTLFNHALNGFDEASGHWVMFPFFKDHTSYGAILALVYPVLFGLLFAKKNGPLLRLTLITLIILLGVGIFFSYTRAAWLSLVGALVVYLLIRFKVHFKYLAAIGFVGILYIANISTDASNLERLNRWGSAIRMWQERPVLGWGPGTYAMEYAPFQLASGKTIISTNSGNMGNAHSEYLGPLSEQGLPGMLLMLILVGYIIYTGITLYIRMPDSPMRLLMLTMLLGLITYFTHGILNNYLDTDKATIPVWGFTAIIVMLDLKYPKKTKDADLSETSNM